MRLGFVVNMVRPKILGFGGGRRLVRDFAAGRLYNGAFAGGDAGTRYRMILNVINRLVEAGAVVTLQIGMSVRKPRNRSAFDYRWLVIGKVLALTGRGWRSNRNGDDERQNNELPFHITSLPWRRLPGMRGTHIPAVENSFPCGAKAAC